jgi:hypothetical protein
MKTHPIDRALLEQLSRPEPRLPALERWLLEEVWSERALHDVRASPRDYLLLGERIVAELLPRALRPNLRRIHQLRGA